MERREEQNFNLCVYREVRKVVGTKLLVAMDNPI